MITNNKYQLVLNNTVSQLHVRTDLRGGQSSGGTVNGVYYPDMSGVCEPVTAEQPTNGGYVNSVYYPDMSGVCGSSSTIPPTTGGGYVNGIYYSDKSGTC